MIDIRFFRRGHFRKTLIEDGRLVVQEHVDNGPYNKLVILALVAIGAAIVVLSHLHGAPFTPSHANFIMAVILLVAVVSWFRLKKEHQIWTHIQGLPEREQVDAAVGQLKKPFAMWRYIGWVAFVILLISRDGSGLLSPSFLEAMPELRLSIYLLSVLVVSSLVGWFIYDQHHRIQDADLDALERWRGELE